MLEMYNLSETRQLWRNEKRGLWYLFWRSYKTSLLSMPQCTL